MNDSEINNLRQSFDQIEREKETMVSENQANISFLNHKNEFKNNKIKQLQRE